MSDNPFRNLPAVDQLVDALDSSLPRGLLVDVARDALDRARRDIETGKSADALALAQSGAEALHRSAGTSVVNATGVLLHTNLGRSRWSRSAMARGATAAGQFTNLEMDLTDGRRSRRGGYVTRLLTSLTGAEDALVVNNNASALFLALAATAAGRSAIVARGELIEIGGSYRLPDVMAVSGTRMVEVGTTNRSRIGDYETELQLHDVGAILKIHPSNYRVVGFTSETTIDEIAALNSDAAIIHDIGSGLLDSSATWVPDWLKDEPGAIQSLSAGADLVLFSGDKLLGGPQAGVIVGRSEVVDALRSHPLARALRVDGVTLAALGATLEAHGNGPPMEVPLWTQALRSIDEIESRAKTVAQAVGGTVTPGVSTVGGGSAPGAEIPTFIVRITDRDDIFVCLLHQPTPVLGRRDVGDLIVDMRTVEPDQDQTLIDSIRKCL